MKSFIITSMLILALAATNHGKPINDIYSIKDPSTSEEAYVDDIPFNTYDIAVNAIINADHSRLPEESVINDIPFNTERIMYECLLARMVKMYRLEENICDIPYISEYCILKPSFSF